MFVTYPCHFPGDFCFWSFFLSKISVNRITIEAKVLLIPIKSKVSYKTDTKHTNLPEFKIFGFSKKDFQRNFVCIVALFGKKSLTCSSREISIKTGTFILLSKIHKIVETFTNCKLLTIFCFRRQIAWRKHIS